MTQNLINHAHRGRWSQWLLAVLLGCVASAAVTLEVSARELPDFADLVEELTPAVVSITTVQAPSRNRGSRRGAPPEMDEFFRRFFPPDATPSQSLGSGFVISDDGYVLTNNHVIDGAQEITVHLWDRRELVAEVIGTDPRSDLAVLKIDGDDLPTVRVGSSKKLRVGEWVMAIGSPFRFDYSVTAGIVSAKGRSLPDRDNSSYVPFIQTDVAINPGNSGGPLFNLDGEVVGINSQIYTRSGGFMGLSFAIPIDVAMEVAAQLQDSGSVSRGWLGVVIQEVNRDLAESFGLDRPGGALVVRVFEDGPAAKAGLQEGDIITAFNGNPIALSSELPALVGRERAGARATMDVVRDGKTIRLKVKVGELSESGAAVTRTGGGEARADRVGLAVAELSDADKERLGINGGVAVTSVSGPGAAAGIQPGDVITRLNNRSIDSTAGFAEVVDSLNPGSSVPVLIVRGGNATFLALRVPAE